MRSLSSEGHRTQVPFAKLLRVAEGKRRICDTGWRWKFEFKKGARKLCCKFAATEVTVDGPEHGIVREDDFIGS